MSAPLPPRDAPRCLRCGVLLPMHVAGCPEMRPPLSDAEFDPLFETEQDDDATGLDAVSRPLPYVVEVES